VARIACSVTAGLMLSQAIYWSSRTQDGSGWFHKTGWEWEEETGLSRCEQETARRLLIERALPREQLRGMPAKMYYLVQIAAVRDGLASLQKTSKQVRRKPTNKKPAKPAREKTADMCAENLQTPPINTETTSQNTADNYHAYGDLKKWFSIKKDLKKQLPTDEWKLWVRPAYLLKVASGRVLLIAVPPNGRIVEAARARRAFLEDLARHAGYSGVGFTHYPDEHDRQRLQTEYPDFHAQMFGNNRVRDSSPRQQSSVADLQNHEQTARDDLEPCEAL
jgi:hypothetical protein